MSTFPFARLSDAHGAIKVKNGKAWEYYNQADNEKGNNSLLMVCAMAVCTAGAIFLSRSGQPASDVKFMWQLASLTFGVLTMVVALVGLVFWLGVTHYLCAMDDGKLYWSRQDPRVDSRRFVPGEMPGSKPHYWQIVGNVVRVRNGGTLFKILYYLTHFRPYNCVFSPGNPEPSMFLTFDSSVYEATLCQGRMRYGSFSADAFLQIRNLPSFFAQQAENAKHLEELRTGLRVIHHYLTEVPDRTKRSKPGQWIATTISRIAFWSNTPLTSVPTSEMTVMAAKLAEAEVEVTT